MTYPWPTLMPMGIVVISCIRPSVQPSVGLGLCIADKALGRNGLQFGMLMYPDGLHSAFMDANGYCCWSVCPSICSFTAFTGDICCHYWQHIPVLNGRNGLKFDGRNGLKFDMLMYNKYLRGAPKDDGCVVDLRESYRFRTFTCLVLISDVVTELSRVLLWFCFPLAVWSLFIHLVPAV